MNQGLESKSVPKIVKARSGVIDCAAQADLTRESIKGSAHVGAFQATAMIVEQKAGGALSWHQPVATLCVFGQDIPPLFSTAQL